MKHSKTANPRRKCIVCYRSETPKTFLAPAGTRWVCNNFTCKRILLERA